MCHSVFFILCVLSDFMLAPVSQNQIHINLVNYKHRCMRQFFGEFFGESHRYNQLEVKISVFSTTLRS